MSLIVLYFLHSTSVLSFYIDVVLTLSICGPISYQVSSIHCKSMPQLPGGGMIWCQHLAHFIPSLPVNGISDCQTVNRSAWVFWSCNGPLGTMTSGGAGGMTSGWTGSLNALWKIACLRIVAHWHQLMAFIFLAGSLPSSPTDGW